jgi:threonyl-tRNA synthetase
LSKYTDDTLAYECISVLYKNKPFNLDDANTIVDKFMNSPKHRDALLMEKMVKELYFDKSNNLVPRIENIENIGISVNQIEYNIDGVTEYAIITVINTR